MRQFEAPRGGRGCRHPDQAGQLIENEGTRRTPLDLALSGCAGHRSARSQPLETPLCRTFGVDVRCHSDYPRGSRRSRTSWPRRQRALAAKALAVGACIGRCQTASEVCAWGALDFRSNMPIMRTERSLFREALFLLPLGRPSYPQLHADAGEDREPLGPGLGECFDAFLRSGRQVGGHACEACAYRAKYRRGHHQRDARHRDCASGLRRDALRPRSACITDSGHVRQLKSVFDCGSCLFSALWGARRCACEKCRGFSQASAIALLICVTAAEHAFSAVITRTRLRVGAPNRGRALCAFLCRTALRPSRLQRAGSAAVRREGEPAYARSRVAIP